MTAAAVTTPKKTKCYFWNGEQHLHRCPEFSKKDAVE
jgi:hypothetical protein